MATVVCVHGIGQQHKGPEILRSQWEPALRDGLRLANDKLGRTAQSEPSTAYAFYGDLFREQGRALSVGDPWLTTEDLTEFEVDLLLELWRAAAESDPAVIHPEARTLLRTPRSAQAALRALSGSRFFAGLADRALLFDLRQVRLYLTDLTIRNSVRERVAKVVSEDTRVMVGHSLGSVVAYETLCAHPEWPVRVFVSLGSPLGIRRLVFDRLDPSPMKISDSRLVGHWPGSVKQWANIADEGDVVALVKDIRLSFGDNIMSCIINNGAHAHDVTPYLTAAETGAAILQGVTSSDNWR